MVNRLASSAAGRSRTVRRFIHTCLALCVVFAVMFLISIPLSVTIGPVAKHRVKLFGGRIHVVAESPHGNHQPRPCLDIHANLDGVQWLSDGHIYDGWWFVRLPLWMPFGASALAAGGVWLLQRLRVPPGHCRRCRYDLRSQSRHDDPARRQAITCPECGTTQSP